jgi:hypothetical protein
LLDPVLRDTVPLLLFTLAVVVSAIRGGFGPGILSTVVDILEALKKSIAMKRKPDASETQPARKAPGRVTGTDGKRPSRKAR